MLLGSLSIAGFPLFSGFWSKDMVLEAAFGPWEEGLGFGSWFCVLFILGMITAFMTAFYMFRMWFMTFVGEPRENAQHCHGESSRSMTTPLIVLAVFAVGSGLLILFGLGDVIAESLDASHIHSHMHSGSEILETILGNMWTYVSIGLALGGILIAFLMYSGRRLINPGIFNRNGESILYKILANRYYFPQLYDQISWKLGYGVARGVDYLDKNVVDGTVNGMSNAVIGSGDTVSKMQTGYVRDYAAVVVIGAMVLIGILFLAFYVGGL